MFRWICLGRILLDIFWGLDFVHDIWYGILLLSMAFEEEHQSIRTCRAGGRSATGPAAAGVIFF